MRIGAMAAIAVALVVALRSVAAQQYPITVTSNLQGMNVKVEPVIAGPVVVVKLTNQSAVGARCTLGIVNGPQFPFNRTINVPAGSDGSVAFRPTVEVLNLNIDVLCEAASDPSAPPPVSPPTKGVPSESATR